MFSYQLKINFFLIQLVKSVVQEERQSIEQQEAKTVKVKTTAVPKPNSFNKRFSALKTTNVKTPVQDDHAQTIEEPTSKTFKRSNRFSARQQN